MKQKVSDFSRWTALRLQRRSYFVITSRFSYCNKGTLKLLTSSIEHNRSIIERRETERVCVPGSRFRCRTSLIPFRQILSRWCTNFFSRARRIYWVEEGEVERDGVGERFLVQLLMMAVETEVANGSSNSRLLLSGIHYVVPLSALLFRGRAHWEERETDLLESAKKRDEARNLARDIPIVVIAGLLAIKSRPANPMGTVRWQLTLWSNEFISSFSSFYCPSDIKDISDC